MISQIFKEINSIVRSFKMCDNDMWLGCLQKYVDISRTKLNWIYVPDWVSLKTWKWMHGTVINLIMTRPILFIACTATHWCTPVQIIWHICKASDRNVYQPLGARNALENGILDLLYKMNEWISYPYFYFKYLYFVLKLKVDPEVD